MATEIYLGTPPQYVIDWVESHSKPAEHAETIFTFNGNKQVSLNIIGELSSSIWKLDDKGEDPTYENILNYDGSDILYQRDLIMVDIGNSVSSIGDNVFQDSMGLTSIIIPNTVTSIGNFVFQGRMVIENIIIPDSVTDIGEWCFAGNNALKSVTFGSNVRNIGSMAFYECYGLTNVTFKDKTLTQVQAMDNYPWEINNTSIINIA